MKNIWIFNHYAGPPSVTTGLRHYYFAKELIAAGYSVTVFAASTVHNTDRNLIEDDHPYLEMEEDGVPFVFVRTDSYQGNGKKRIINMLQYYRRLFKVTKHFSKPDVIIGSSVHPLACVAAIKLAKKHRCRCIAEIRDLWPESIATYGILSKRNPLMKLLYAGEKWIYRKADALIFTMEGGKDYLTEKGWDKDIPLDKVYHINNGIDLESYRENRQGFQFDDADLEDSSTWKVIYTGSIRRVNHLQTLVLAAEELQKRQAERIRLLVYGDGDEREALEKLAAEKGLQNIVFKGRVDKKYIPYVLSCAGINLIHVQNTPIMRFGCSLNKLFDYFASGKPILSDLSANYDLIKRYQAGIVLDTQEPTAIADEICRLAEMPAEERSIMGQNALQAAKDHDYSNLTKRLIEVLEITRDI